MGRSAHRLQLIEQMTFDVPAMIRACTPSVMLDQPFPSNLAESDVSVSFGALGSPLGGTKAFAEVNEAVRRCYGPTCQRAWSLTNGSSGANWAIAKYLRDSLDPDQVVLVARGAHLSVPQALTDFGVRWQYLPGRYDEAFEAILPVEASDVAAALASTETVGALWLISPTYEGLQADMAAIDGVRRQHEAASGGVLLLVVDEAWGSHFPAHSSFVTALAAGADISNSSTHKQAGSFQGAAVVCLRHESRADETMLAAAVQSMMSTSPPFVLFGSIGYVYEELAANGEARVGDLISRASRFRSRVARLCSDYKLTDFAEVTKHSFDPLKVTYRLNRADGLSGFLLAEILADLGVLVEKEGLNTVTFLITFQMEDHHIDAMAGALKQALDAHTPTNEPRVDLPNPFLGEGTTSVVTSISDVRRARARRETERVALAGLPGRVAAERIAAYPPGIPIILEGQRIGEEQVGYLEAIGAAGGHFASNSGHPVDDEDLHVLVLKER